MFRAIFMLLVLLLVTACGGDSSRDAGSGTDASSADAPTADVPTSDRLASDAAPQLDAVAPGDVTADAGPRARNASNRRACMSDSDCDDGFNCTEDTCADRMATPTGPGEGRCRYRPVSNLCPMGQACDLRRGCQMGRVCATDTDCTDRDDCTQGERCDNATRLCVYDAVLDVDGDGYSPPRCGGTDCDDTMASTHPDQYDGCDNQDNNCNGIIDEPSPSGRTCEGHGAGGLYACMAGRCVCLGPYQECLSGGTALACVDLQSDPFHCGTCGNWCGEGGMCVRGACQCPAGRMTCPGVGCLDLQTNPQHCGRCGNACPPGATCVAGACACPTSGQVACMGTCVNTQTDVMNCGMCGRPCGTAATCAAGTCRCSSDQTLCPSGCANLMSDPGNCGECGVTCTTPEKTCMEGVCLPSRPCLDGLMCGGRMVCPSFDPVNCGRCGNRCPLGQRCLRGVCGS